MTPSECEGSKHRTNKSEQLKIAKCSHMFAVESKQNILTREPYNIVSDIDSLPSEVPGCLGTPGRLCVIR